MSTSEAVIVSALKSGNLRRAVELMLDIYQEELFAYCARLVGASEATHVYQRVLSSALHEIFSLGGQTTVRAWLFRIAREAIVGFHRAHPRAFPEAAGAEQTFYVPIAGPGERSSGGELPGLRARDEQMEQACARVEAAALEALQLALWHGLQLAEVAYVIRRREAEVRRMATQALSLLVIETARKASAPS